MKFNISHPCKLCPFRKDCPEGWLGEARAKQISASCPGGDQAFPCHETTGAGTGRMVRKKAQSQCAGALILTRKQRGDFIANLSFRLAVMAGWFDPQQEMRGEEKIFDSVEDFIKHHAK